MVFLKGSRKETFRERNKDFVQEMLRKFLEYIFYLHDMACVAPSVGEASITTNTGITAPVPDPPQLLLLGTDSRGYPRLPETFPSQIKELVKLCREYMNAQYSIACGKANCRMSVADVTSSPKSFIAKGCLPQDWDMSRSPGKNCTKKILRDAQNMDKAMLLDLLEHWRLREKAHGCAKALQFTHYMHGKQRMPALRPGTKPTKDTTPPLPLWAAVQNTGNTEQRHGNNASTDPARVSTAPGYQSHTAIPDQRNGKDATSQSAGSNTSTSGSGVSWQINTAPMMGNIGNTNEPYGNDGTHEQAGNGTDEGYQNHTAAPGNRAIPQINHTPMNVNTGNTDQRHGNDTTNELAGPGTDGPGNKAVTQMIATHENVGNNASNQPGRPVTEVTHEPNTAMFSNGAAMHSNTGNDVAILGTKKRGGRYQQSCAGNGTITNTGLVVEKGTGASDDACLNIHIHIWLCSQTPEA
ncbi:hypothetical protein DXG01_005843 [Tephrocybe rancida]|nr:hypothetical protein DXG01_005843 [Tephrocybe rancida]